jgi:hypothetical protein
VLERCLAQERLWTNEERAPAFPGQDPARRRQQSLISASVDRTLDLPTQDRELVAENQDLNLRGLIGAVALARIHRNSGCHGRLTAKRTSAPLNGTAATPGFGPEAVRTGAGG